MTGAQIITKFINMVDDELDEDYMYQLMNDAKDEIETDNAWEQTKISTSITASSTALPTRFNVDILLTDGSSKYTKIKKEDQDVRSYDVYTYYLDINGDTIEIINYNSATLILYYTATSADLISTTSWSFPARFHSILPYKMAQLYYASDAGEKSRAWDGRWEKYYTQKWNSMIAWDNRLKSKNRMPLNYGKSPTQI